MVNSLNETADYQPLALAAVDGEDQIAGLFVATKISMAGIWPTSLSSRSVFFDAPIAVPGDLGCDAIESLLAEHDRRMCDQVVFSEIRPISCSAVHAQTYLRSGYEHHHYSNYELDLNQSPDAIFRHMNPKRRNNIRANHRRGLFVREGDPCRELATFYDHLSQSYARSQIPLVDFGYFERVFANFSRNQIRLTFAELDGKPIASACHYAFKGRVHWSHAGTYRIRGIAAQASLVWEAIQWSIQHKHQTYDFAGAGWANEHYGPGVFKERFGGDHVDVGRYRKVYSKWRMKIAETGFRMTRPLLAAGSNEALPEAGDKTPPLRSSR